MESLASILSKGWSSFLVVTCCCHRVRKVSESSTTVALGGTASSKNFSLPVKETRPWCIGRSSSLGVHSVSSVTIACTAMDSFGSLPVKYWDAVQVKVFILGSTLVTFPLPVTRAGIFTASSALHDGIGIGFSWVQTCHRGKYTCHYEVICTSEMVPHQMKSIFWNIWAQIINMRPKSNDLKKKAKWLWQVTNELIA